MSWQSRPGKSLLSAASAIQGDRMAIDKARRILLRAAPGTELSLLSDEQVLRQLSQISASQKAIETSLTFNGQMLRWRQVFSDRIDSISWKAVSGRSGYQSKEFQEKVDQGPIPEGEWLVAQGEYQQMPQRSVLEMLLNEVSRGGWPGGESSWGRHRIWLHPKAGTKTYGRSGFSIHGGSFPGSAGCIDLVEQMPAFVKVFRAHGQDVNLTVKYA